MTAPPDCVVAVDIGTQSTRAALVTADGFLLDCATSPVGLTTPKPGWAEQDPRLWWSTTVANIAAVLARNPGVTVRAIGVGAQMHSVVPVTAGGEPLTARVGLWNDKRPSAQLAQFLARSDAAMLSATAGNAPLPAWAGFKIAWFRDELPEVYAQAAAFVVPKDFINMRLSGELATDPSEASGTFLTDAATGRWSAALLDALNVDAALLPPVRDSAEVIGGVLPAVAAQTGLPAGTPVVAGGGDMLCQLLAAGVTGPGRLAEVAGTASIVASYAAAAHPDPRVMSLRTVSGGWVNFGIGDAAGTCLHWLADHIHGAAGELAQRYEAMTAAAAKIPPGSDGLLFFPYLLGERTLGSERSRGSFIGLTLEHSRDHLTRAVMEGICFENQRALDLIAADDPGAVIRCTGGGARSTLWNQIRADIYQRPVSVLAAREGGILGAAMLAGTAAGWYRSPAEAADQLTALGPTWQPEQAAIARYRAAYATFCAVHDRLAPSWDGWCAGTAQP